MLAVLINPGHRIELSLIPIRIIQEGDRSGIVQEGVRIAHVRLETELVGDVLDRISVIVDFDLIEDIIAELIEVWPAIRSLQGNVVGDQGDGVWLVRADKRVDISIISYRVLRNFGR